MTSDEYRACIKALGLTPIKPSYEGGTLHESANREIIRVIDPEGLEPEERLAVYKLLKMRLGLNDN